jgi:[protein-PII] uridylyltransferase
MPQVDPDLFDRGQFQAELALKASPIAAFKKAIRQAREVLDERFKSGREIRRLIEDRAWFVDNILQQAWEQFDWSEDADIALLAVGGYGRGELHPYSDIDLLILLDSADHEVFRDSIERFLTLLWDIGLEVGQSVRSVDECATEARADLTVITNLTCASACWKSPALARCGRARSFFSPNVPSRKPVTTSISTPSTTSNPMSKAPPAGCETSRPSSGSHDASTAR